MQVLDANQNGPFVVPRVTTHTTDPGSSNDVSQGFYVGDLWVNTTQGVTYVNISNAAGAAAWIQSGSAFPSGTYAGALVAVGTSRANALALTAQVNAVITAASSAVGVVLPPSASVGIGSFVRVINLGPSNSFHVYAAGSDTIDGTAGSTGVALTNAFYADYFVSAAGAFTSYRSPVAAST